jgi:hypothetical protein
MGRYYWEKKNAAEDCRSVSVFFLKKHGYFRGYQSGLMTWKNSFGEQTASIGVAVSTLPGDDYARFQYTSTDRHSGEKTEYDYKVSVTTTPCNFGGLRYWFVCPLYTNGIYCGRRVGTLYLAPGGKYFGCRHCYNLSYESRNESRLGRPGGLGYTLKLECQIERLYGQIKRRTYRGRPTRKFRRLVRMQNKLNAYLDGPGVRELLRK